MPVMAAGACIRGGDETWQQKHQAGYPTFHVF
jgi:hypothetical protein